MDLEPSEARLCSVPGQVFHVWSTESAFSDHVIDSVHRCPGRHNPTDTTAQCAQMKSHANVYLITSRMVMCIARKC